MPSSANPLHFRLLVAALAVLVVTMLGVLWLAVGLELVRTEVGVLRQALRDTDHPVNVSLPDAGLDSLRRDVAALGEKVEALRQDGSSRAVERLTVEVKNLANRLEARNRPSKPSRSVPTRGSDDDEPIVRIPPPQVAVPGLPVYSGY